MSKDLECPYCGNWNEVNHDDGYGAGEDRLHEQDCDSCGKTFTYTTSVHFYYESYKADCLNGAEHEFEAQTCYPKEYTKMKCVNCEETRRPTEEEWKTILNK